MDIEFIMYPSTEEVNQMQIKLGRPPALGKYTPEEVAKKAIELGSFTKAAKFYGVSSVTVSKHVGSIHCVGVDPKHIKDIRAMKDTHTKAMIGAILGYSKSQIDHAGRRNGIVFAMARKPRINTELTHYEMNNMDLIVKNYKSIADCAEDHGVSTRTIDKHKRLSRKQREAAHSSN
ncbi:hypothetical protein NVP1039O_61 [Vibrio phage 1.039.O._10N.286.55.A2]|nr:hypothetical protein NVP1003O_62 [Vibrio phage 1.003.O._10N.286.48.A2]AUR83760.1 hypothetical protein NVP1039O_61 [Vibrio phage 1.039.O._10N.286.55.A2]AUR84639.1 hypothetical protein NVP1061O_58 [Vibrio phage 1.061.O._10N.286.55.C2]AUR85083.1 hypothetical protein NVP1067O_71 [Vibrio phage 1.067.O._10N.261.52.C9]